MLESRLFAINVLFLCLSLSLSLLTGTTLLQTEREFQEGLRIFTFRHLLVSSASMEVKVQISINTSSASIRANEIITAALFLECGNHAGQSRAVHWDLAIRGNLSRRLKMWRRRKVRIQRRRWAKASVAGCAGIEGREWCIKCTQHARASLRCHAMSVLKES